MISDDLKFFLINRALNAIWMIEEATGWASSKLNRAERKILMKSQPQRQCGHRQSASLRGEPCRACAQIAAANREVS